MSEQLIIFDTTLRDGEQSPGASMNLNDKVRIAHVLEKLRVDVIEAGFPIASPGDFESVKAVASTVKDSRVCGLARAVKEDIERAAEAVKSANGSRIHTFLATSPIHMKEKLRLTPEQVIEQIEFAVKLARQYTDDVEFSPEDASRSEPDFLCRVVEVAIKAGATTINIPDTVGYAWPEQYAQSIADLIERVPNSDKAIFSVHCHDDLGLAVSNSLQAVLKGARQIECTINGLGERAGNASLEEIVMAVRTRQDIFPVDTRINTREIMAASRLVSSITGFPVQPNKAIVGANAFAHESGIHQDGVIKKRETYEIMRAEDVGWDTNKIVLGKHSGRNAFKTRLAELGFEFDNDESLKSAFTRFKELADKKREVFDDDLQALVSEEIAEHYQDKYRLVSLRASSTMDKLSHAKVGVTDGEVELRGEADGDGPVDAAFKAIKAMLNVNATLLLYSVNNITGGTDAQGEVTVRLKDDSRIVNGQGADTDIVVASAKAYIAALNKLANTELRFHPQNESLV